MELLLAGCQGYFIVIVTVFSSVLRHFIHSYSFNRQVDITQLQTDREKAITLYS